MIIIPPDGETLLLGFLGMLIAAVSMANILLVIMILDSFWRRHWSKKWLQEQRVRKYTQRGWN